jgi:hypothetical protein
VQLTLGANGWTARSWALLRALLGGYVTVHCALLLPWAGEVYAAMGAAAHSPLFAVVPSPLWLSPTPVVATVFTALGCLCGLSLGLGERPRLAAAGALWVLAGLLAANPLTLNPALPHVGWMLLATVLLPSPPPLRVLWHDATSGASWRLPTDVHAAGWAVAGLAYAYSGATKLTAASWVDGSALLGVLHNPLARDHALRDWLLGQPELLTLATWGALALELAAPLGWLSPRLRPWLWTALLGLQLGLLALVDFADLTWGMLVLQAWLFDPAWVRRRYPAGATVSG